MDIRQAFAGNLLGTPEGMRDRRRRLLPFLSVVILAAVTLGLLVLLGGVPVPESAPRLASARESEADTAASASQPAKSQLLTLSSGDVPLLQSLQERRSVIEQREKQLAKREEELRQLEQWIEGKLQTLTLLRNEIGALVEERKAFEAQRFEHLVKVYEGMKPAEAASLIERLHEDTAVKLFYRMKGRKVSQILEFVKPEVAARLSERLAVHEKQVESKADKEAQ
jgi:flagellar motility protein MotE (MotC chaperone)